MRAAYAAAFGLALATGSARAQEAAPFITGGPPPATTAPAPTIPPPPPSPPPLPTSTVLDGVPPAAGCPCASGDAGSRFAVDVMLGQFLGFRGQGAVYRDPYRAVVLEGFYGALLNKFDSSEGIGAGARYYIRRTDRAGCNSVLFGPGAGMYYHFDSEVWMLAPTMDIAWVRAIGDHGAWQIGLNAGVGVAVSGDYGNSSVTPLFTLFTGFRF